MKLTVPYLKLRGGRPRWEPGPKLRGAGWKGQDLRDAAGRWLGLDAAIAEARALNAEVEAWRATGQRRRQPPLAMKPARTCDGLAEIWRASPAWGALAPKTQSDYRSKLGVFLAEFGGYPVAAIRTSDLHTWWEELVGRRGHAMANGTLAVARALLSYGRLKGWREDNPASRLGMTTVPPRAVLWLPAECEHLVATAEAMGRPSVADAFVVALHTGQRQGDVLHLPARLFTADRIKLSQAKTKAKIDAPMTRQLADRIAEMRRRRVTERVVDLEAPLILDERGRPYTSDSFGKAWRAVRAAAAKTMPEVGGKHFLDLRDTAVTRLALADCTIPHICAITGHEIKSAAQIIKHYLVLQPAMADTAIRQLQVYLDQQGIAV